MNERASSSGEEVGKESVGRNGAESDTRRQRGKIKKRKMKGGWDGTRVESVENGVSVRTVKLKNGPRPGWLIRKRSRACHQPSGLGPLARLLLIAAFCHFCAEKRVGGKGEERSKE